MVRGSWLKTRGSWHDQGTVDPSKGLEAALRSPAMASSCEPCLEPWHMNGSTAIEWLSHCQLYLEYAELLDARLAAPPGQKRNKRHLRYSGKLHHPQLGNWTFGQLLDWIPVFVKGGMNQKMLQVPNIPLCSSNVLKDRFENRKSKQLCFLWFVVIIFSFFYQKQCFSTEPCQKQGNRGFRCGS